MGSGIARVLKLIGLIVLGVIFGLFGFSLLFSDLGPGESLLSRLIMAAMVFLTEGIIIGYVDRTNWVISVIIGWGGVLLALQTLLNRDSSPMQTVVLLLISPGMALLGGYLGSILGKKWPLEHFLRGWRRRRH